MATGKEFGRLTCSVLLGAVSSTGLPLTYLEFVELFIQPVSTLRMFGA
jgi:hypothetical protein